MPPTARIPQGELLHRFENVRMCSACGGDHDGLRFDPLIAEVYFGGHTWRWSAMCPTNGEGVFLRDAGE